MQQINLRINKTETIVQKEVWKLNKAIQHCRGKGGTLDNYIEHQYCFFLNECTWE